MVHVYNLSQNNFTYSYAPLGLNCTMIAIGVKDKKLYYAKQNFTISSNYSTTFTMTETTSNDLLALLNSLNN